MKLTFDLESIETIEFGVGVDAPDGAYFRFVHVDGAVQGALHEMTIETWEQLGNLSGDASRYDPAEKYSSVEYVFLPLGDDHAIRLKELHDANNLEFDLGWLNATDKVFCYFARLHDRRGRRLTALRRASQFKGVLKKRLLRVMTDALKIVEDQVFKLDSDFDLLIDSRQIHILRPAGFEFAGQLQSAILKAVPKNVKAVAKELPFVEFSGLQEYCETRPRAARYLASIRASNAMKDIDRRLLRKLCADSEISIRSSNGKMIVQPGKEMDFLELLDRRRFGLELVRGRPERYRAPSRRRIN